VPSLHLWSRVLERENGRASPSEKLGGFRLLLDILIPAFAFFCGWFLSRQNSQGSIKPQNHVGDVVGRRQNGDAQGVPVIIDSMPAPTPSVEEKRENAMENRRKTIKFYAELVVSFFVCVYTVVSVGLWCEARESAEATRMALVTSQRQLDATERPWLKVSLVAGAITFQQGGMQFAMTPQITNIGHSVATGVVVPINVMLASSSEDFFKEPLRKQAELCDPIASKPLSNQQDETQMSVFPDSTDSSLVVGSGFSEKELRQAPNANSNFRAKHIVPIVIGCVDYQYGTAIRHHQTRFIYEVFRSGTAPNTSIEVGTDVPGNDVRLVPYPFGGFHAY
jgi:hypothetical protein